MLEMQTSSRSMSVIEPTPDLQTMMNHCPAQHIMARASGVQVCFVNIAGTSTRIRMELKDAERICKSERARA